MSSGNNMTRVILGLILAGLSAALLTLSFPPYGLWPLAWVGFVPMIVAQYRILPEPISSLASAVGIGGFFWGYFGAAFRGAVWYMRWLPALIAIAVFFASSRDRRFHERTNYRFFVLQPAVVWVGIEFIRGSMLRDGALTGRTIRWRTLEKPASPGEPIPPLVLRGANWAL